MSLGSRNAGDALTEDGVKDFLKGQIAHFKVTRHIRIFDEIPMTITGNPQKFLMRDQMLDLPN